MRSTRYTFCVIPSSFLLYVGCLAFNALIIIRNNIGQAYQYSCPFHADTTEDVVMYRDIMPSRYSPTYSFTAYLLTLSFLDNSSQEKLYDLIHSHSSPCVSSEAYTNEVTALFDCRVCALYCYASARNLVTGQKITHVYFNYAGMLNDLGLLYSYVNNAPKAIELFEEAIRYTQLLCSRSFDRSLSQSLTQSLNAASITLLVVH